MSAARAGNRTPLRSWSPRANVERQLEDRTQSDAPIMRTAAAGNYGGRKVFLVEVGADTSATSAAQGRRDNRAEPESRAFHAVPRTEEKSDRSRHIVAASRFNRLVASGIDGRQFIPPCCLPARGRVTPDRQKLLGQTGAEWRTRRPSPKGRHADIAIQ